MSIAAAAPDPVLDLLRCPKCRGALDRIDAHELRCRQCGSRTAVVNGIPRFVSDDDFDASEGAGRTRASFGYEWTHFNDWKPSGRPANRKLPP